LGAAASVNAAAAAGGGGCGRAGANAPAGALASASPIGGAAGGAAQLRAAGPATHALRHLTSSLETRGSQALGIARAASAGLR